MNPPDHPGSASSENAPPGTANLPIGSNLNANRKIGPVLPANNGVFEISNRIASERVGEEANLEIGGPGDPWRSRGYLPHFEHPDAIQHVTFHLADSLPKGALEQMEGELKSLPIEKQAVERRKRLEAWIDAGHGSCVLREPVIAEMVQNSLLHFDAERYSLLAWAVMPNHVHALFEPKDGWVVGETVASWKKFTARRISDYLKEANREIGGPGGAIWHREYWDRYMRNEDHLRETIDYVHQNPVKAGLCLRAEAWRWSSAYPGPPISEEEEGTSGARQAGETRLASSPAPTEPI